MKTKFLTFIFLLLKGSIFAQTLPGTVVDQYQQRIPEVTILNKNTDQHTHSDKQGGFIFENVSVGDSLQFYHISYKTKTVVVKDLKTPLNVVLYANSTDLSEVVIVPRINALHVITDIDIQMNPVNSSQDVLRKVPGLFIGQHAGGGKGNKYFYGALILITEPISI